MVSEVEFVPARGNGGGGGEVGPQGPRGFSVLNGKGAPAPALGQNEEFYIDEEHFEIYGPKTAGSWGVGTKLIGPEGPKGTTGTSGAVGEKGEKGLVGEKGEKGEKGETGAGGKLEIEEQKASEGVSANEKHKPVAPTKLCFINITVQFKEAKTKATIEILVNGVKVAGPATTDTPGTVAPVFNFGIWVPPGQEYEVKATITEGALEGLPKVGTTVFK